MFLVTLSDLELIGLVLSTLTNVALLLLLLLLLLSNYDSKKELVCLKSVTRLLLLIFVEGLKKSPPLFPNQIELRSFFICHSPVSLIEV